MPHANSEAICCVDGPADGKCISVVPGTATYNHAMGWHPNDGPPPADPGPAYFSYRLLDLTDAVGVRQKFFVPSAMDEDAAVVRLHDLGLIEGRRIR